MCCDDVMTSGGIKLCVTISAGNIMSNMSIFNWISQMIPLSKFHVD